MNPPYTQLLSPPGSAAVQPDGRLTVTPMDFNLSPPARTSKGFHHCLFRSKACGKTLVSVVLPPAIFRFDRRKDTFPEPLTRARSLQCDPDTRNIDHIDAMSQDHIAITPVSFPCVSCSS